MTRPSGGGARGQLDLLGRRTDGSQQDRSPPDVLHVLQHPLRPPGIEAAQLESKGIAVKIDPEKYPNGRFARLHDPEGNPIELWQPKV